MPYLSLPSLLLMGVILLLNHANIVRAFALPSDYGSYAGDLIFDVPRSPESKFSCSTPPPPPHILAVHRQWRAEEKARELGLKSGGHQSHANSSQNHSLNHHDATTVALHPRQTIVLPDPKPGPASNPNTPNHQIDMYIHVVSTAAKSPVATAQMVSDQFNVLQDMYSKQGFDFNLKNVSYTINDGWATDQDDVGMKEALRTGSYRDYNLYILASLKNGSLGYCTVAYDVTPGLDFSRDGCNVAAGTLPGGDAAGYNMGRTAVHETGHWFGLLHTFEGNNCTGPGDYVGDTRAEKDSTAGCPARKNTCPELGDGEDPIHNYMDYSWDSW